MVLYFTGTGNSRFVAQNIADIIGDKAVSISGFITKEEKPVFIANEVYVFVAPCYVSSTAKAMVDFIMRSDFPKGIRAYFVITSASYMGASAETNKRLCLKKGFEYMGTAEVYMPQNYIVYFDMKSEEENRRIVNDAIPVIKRFAGLIKDNKPFLPNKCHFGEYLVTNLACRLFYPLFMKTGKFKATEKCISCRKCLDLCPLNNISFNDGKPVWGNKCTHCMACINLCPVSAIEYGKNTAGKTRYKGPLS